MVIAVMPFAASSRNDNTALDRKYYDVEVLSPAEHVRLAGRGKAEGVILEIGPSAAPSLKVWSSLADCSGALAPHYAAITVAGVGSSALGAAALGRNVADAVDAPVLAVVAGNGMGDLTGEALGGFFVFGGINALRHGAAVMNRSIGTLRAFWPWLAPPAFDTFDPAQGFMLAHLSTDVRSLAALLAGQVKTDLLVGHSKGNLVISEALFAVRRQQPARYAEFAPHLRVVTFGARIAMPPEIASVIDVMGSEDRLGEFNSRRDIAVDVSVPGADHHTNTRLKGHVPVTQVLKQVLKGDAA
jgi:hypothetical protein